VSWPRLGEAARRRRRARRRRALVLLPRWKARGQQDGEEEVKRVRRMLPWMRLACPHSEE
jgi:hypothetical protein